MLNYSVAELRLTSNSKQAENKKIYTQPYGVKKVFSALFRGQIKDSAREHKQTNLFLSKSILSLHFTQI